VEQNLYCYTSIESGNNAEDDGERIKIRLPVNGSKKKGKVYKKSKFK